MGDHDYSQDDDNPLARLYRQQAEQELRDANATERLLASLTPEDAQAELFTFEEIRRWGLKHCRKRAKDVEDE